LGYSLTQLGGHHSIQARRSFGSNRSKKRGDAATGVERKTAQGDSDPWPAGCTPMTSTTPILEEEKDSIIMEVLRGKSDS